MSEQIINTNDLITQEQIRDVKCDATDYTTAAFCGGIAGLVDVVFVGAPGDSKLQAVGDHAMDSFVQRAAQFFFKHDKREKEKPKKAPDTLEKCISYLEQAFPVPYDARYAKDLNVADSVLADMNPTNHHLKSLAHSPDPIGLVFSIIDQFSNSGTFFDNGKIIHAEPKKTSGAFPYMVGGSFPAKLFCGFLNWLGHLISDAVGSSSTRAEKKRLAGNDSRGMGIPLPFYSLLQQFDYSKNDNASIADVMTKVFEQGYDARFGLTMSIPVVFQALAVRVFWMLRRKINFDLTWKECIPTDKHADLRIMMLVSNGVFCAVDGVDALVRGVGGGAVAGVCRLNLIGWSRLAILGIKEIKIRLGLVIGDSSDQFMENIFGMIPDKEKAWITSAVHLLQQDYSLLGALKMLKQSLEEHALAKEERIRIEAECEKIVF
ncbi:MAG: hypothetical protein K6C36_02250, partial [Clostridia bacterium]|nr:hypothetical protein [Clostridia bacterium]